MGTWRMLVRSWQLVYYVVVLLQFQNVSCWSVSVVFAEKNLGFRFGLGFHDKLVVNFMTTVIWYDFHHRYFER